MRKILLGLTCTIAIALLVPSFCRADGVTLVGLQPSNLTFPEGIDFTLSYTLTNNSADTILLNGIDGGGGYVDGDVSDMAFLTGFVGTCEFALHALVSGASCTFSESYTTLDASGETDGDFGFQTAPAAINYFECNKTDCSSTVDENSNFVLTNLTITDPGFIGTTVPEPSSSYFLISGLLGLLVVPKRLRNLPTILS